MTERRRRGPRRALTEEAILDAALELLDEGGADAASIRTIAARVGVAPNAVYTYFPSKAAVLRAVVERILGDIEHDVAADRARPWRERVESLALHVRERVLAHPAALPLMVGGPLDGRNALALHEQLLDLMGDAGLPPSDAARAAYLLVVYLFGAMALNVAQVPEPGPLPPEAERVAARRRRFAAVPTESFPRTAAAADTIATYVTSEQFLWGLRRVLDGISALAAHTATDGSPA
ncbi:MAG TPA: TetR/AcrR family transcriptional regulator [Egibacteraceae bacterium]